MLQRRSVPVVFCLLIFVLLALPPQAAANQQIDYDGLKFTMLPDFEARTYFGYKFIRVLISNRSGRERQIRLSLNADYSRDLEQISKTLVIPASESREEALFFPLGDFSSVGLVIEVDGREIEEKLLKYLRSYKNYYAKKQALVDAKIPRNDFEAVFGPSGMAAGLNLELSQFDGSLAQLYSNWLAYTQFNLIIYFAESLREMPEPVRAAIFDYVRAGGALMVLGEPVLPKDFVRIDNAEASMFTTYEGGFGRVMAFREDFMQYAVAASEPELTLPNGDKIPKPARGKPGNLNGLEVSDIFSDRSFQDDSPLPFDEGEVETVSARWLMLIIYLFAFLIGPVNVFVLHRLGRRILVFVTVPVASFICCVFIYGYYVIFESSTLLGKRNALILLDERDNRAITLANYSIYSARSRAEGFRFDMQTEVFPVNRNDYRSNDSGKYIVLDEDQHLREGWIKPKIPRYMHLRSIQTRRERLALTAKNGALEVMNGLGADIEEVVLMTSGGRVFRSTGIRAGAAAGMDEVRGVSASWSSLPEVGKRGWFNVFDHIKVSPYAYLKPGTYVARLNRSPFLRQAIDEEAEITESACLIGILKEEPSL